MIVDINAIVENMNAEIEEVRQKYVTIFNDDFNIVLQAIKDKYPALEVVYIRAWTPHWNDGEECKHNMSVHVDNNGKYTDIEEFFECTERNFDWDEAPDCIKNVNKGISTKMSKEIVGLFEAYQDSFESILGTNWKMTIDFTQERPIMVKEDYECGY
ncbi:hypothetical protein RCIP0023_00459 [Klebsiella phage RCIP0023]